MEESRQYSMPRDERAIALNDAQYRAYAAMRRSDRNAERPENNQDRNDAIAWAQVAEALKN